MATIRYLRPDREYFDKRSLRRHAGVLHLWALGVGAVISGDFFGWNFGLMAGGFGGMLCALLIMTALFLGLCCAIAEMSPALPHAGGAYSFARAAMGPWGGYVTGLAENMEYILTPAVIVVGIGGYLGTIFGTPPGWAPVWWLACYVIFLAFNMAGVEASFRVTIIVTVCALGVLLVFIGGAIPRFHLHRWAMDEGSWLPYGWSGVVRALPFALWVYLGIEQLPLAAEEARDPARDMPKATLLGLATLVIFALLTVVLNAGIAPGARVVGRSDEPLLLALRTIFGDTATARFLALAGCAGLIASFHAIVFAYGRQIYSLSRAGYFPVWLSVTHGVRQTPERALIAGSALGYSTALAIHISGPKSPAGAVLLNMAVFGAVIAYVLQLVSFILLRARFPDMCRPWKNPTGVAGAAIACAIALLTLGSLFMNADYRPGVLGAAVWFLCGIAWFSHRKRGALVLAPEERFAEELGSEAPAEAATRAITAVRRPQ